MVTHSDTGQPKPLSKPCFWCQAPRYDRSTPYCAACEPEHGLKGLQPVSAGSPAPAVDLLPANTRTPRRDDKAIEARGGCATCAHWAGWRIESFRPGVAPYFLGANCGERNGSLNTRPRLGCERWIREAGADDEPFDWRRLEARSSRN